MAHRPGQSNSLKNDNVWDGYLEWLEKQCCNEGQELLTAANRAEDRMRAYVKMHAEATKRAEDRMRAYVNMEAEEYKNGSDLNESAFDWREWDNFGHNEKENERSQNVKPLVKRSHHKQNLTKVPVNQQQALQATLPVTADPWGAPLPTLDQVWPWDQSEIVSEQQLAADKKLLGFGNAGTYLAGASDVEDTWVWDPLRQAHVYTTRAEDHDRCSKWLDEAVSSWDRSLESNPWPTAYLTQKRLIPTNTIAPRAWIPDEVLNSDGTSYWDSIEHDEGEEGQGYVAKPWWDCYTTSQTQHLQSIPQPRCKKNKRPAKGGWLGSTDENVEEWLKTH